VIGAEAPVQLGRRIRAAAGMDRDHLPGSEREIREGVRVRGPAIRDRPARHVDGVRAGVQDGDVLAGEAHARHHNDAGSGGGRQQDEGDADQDRRERCHATIIMGRVFTGAEMVVPSIIENKTTASQSPGCSRARPPTALIVSGCGDARAAGSGDGDGAGTVRQLRGSARVEQGVCDQ